jgi:hypothetical protein
MIHPITRIIGAPKAPIIFQPADPLMTLMNGAMNYRITTGAKIFSHYEFRLEGHCSLKSRRSKLI